MPRWVVLHVSVDSCCVREWILLSNRFDSKLGLPAGVLVHPHHQKALRRRLLLSGGNLGSTAVPGRLLLRQPVRPRSVHVAKLLRSWFNGAGCLSCGLLLHFHIRNNVMLAGIFLPCWIHEAACMSDWLLLYRPFDKIHVLTQKLLPRGLNKADAVPGGILLPDALPENSVHQPSILQSRLDPARAMSGRGVLLNQDHDPVPRKELLPNGLNGADPVLVGLLLSRHGEHDRVFSDCLLSGGVCVGRIVPGWLLLH